MTSISDEFVKEYLELNAGDLESNKKAANFAIRKLRTMPSIERNNYMGLVISPNHKIGYNPTTSSSAYYGIEYENKNIYFLVKEGPFVLFEIVEKLETGKKYGAKKVGTNEVAIVRPVIASPQKKNELNKVYGEIIKEAGNYANH